MRGAVLLLAVLCHCAGLVLVFTGYPWAFIFFGAGATLTGAVWLEDHMNENYPDQEDA